MNHLNRVSLLGHAGRDAQKSTTAKGVPTARFTVATNKRYKDANGDWRETTAWHTVVAFGPLAERAAAVTAGTLLFIEGELSYREHEREVEVPGKSAVAVRWPITEIVASAVSVLQRGTAAAQNGSQPKTRKGAAA